MQVCSMITLISLTRDLNIINLVMKCPDCILTASRHSRINIILKDVPRRTTNQS